MSITDRNPRVPCPLTAMERAGRWFGQLTGSWEAVVGRLAANGCDRLRRVGRAVRQADRAADLQWNLLAYVDAAVEVVGGPKLDYSEL
jgi:hypothetical protein